MATARLDPNRNTREEFTLAAQQQPIPPAASPKWQALNRALRDLQLKLLYHEAMAANRSQPFMTPAASKNKVYFMWDFVSRTLPNLYVVGPVVPEGGEGGGTEGEGLDEARRKIWTVDCLARSLQAGQMILGDGAGVGGAGNSLNSMIESMYRDQKGRHPEFGREVEEAARKLVEACGA